MLGGGYEDFEESCSLLLAAFLVSELAAPELGLFCGFEAGVSF
jgi:hypothetical protein